ncbi:hypothetical protein Trydic_g2682 [Trypoxylus dichotomus]
MEMGRTLSETGRSEMDKSYPQMVAKHRRWVDAIRRCRSLRVSIGSKILLRHGARKTTGSVNPEKQLRHSYEPEYRVHSYPYFTNEDVHQPADDILIKPDL